MREVARDTKTVLVDLRKAFLACVVSAAIATDPLYSVAPDCLRVAPDGSIDLDVIVRGTDGMDLPGYEVRLIFFEPAASALSWCPGQSHPVISGITDDEARITFNVAAGGCVHGG